MALEYDNELQHIKPKVHLYVLNVNSLDRYLQSYLRSIKRLCTSYSKTQVRFENNKCRLHISFIYVTVEGARQNIHIRETSINTEGGLASRIHSLLRKSVSLVKSK